SGQNNPAVILFALFPPRNPNSPPCIGGWIPWLGAAFQFGKAPLEFIEQARVKYGPIFTVFALGNRFTFVTEDEGIEAFFTSKDIDFEQAVQETVQRTTSVPAEIFYRNRSRLYSMMKGKMGTSSLYLFARPLCQELHEHMDCLGTAGTENLRDLIRSVLYPATVNILFGKGVCPTNKSDIKEFEEHFQKYDEDFEYGSQMPEYFMSLANLLEVSYPGNPSSISPENNVLSVTPFQSNAVLTGVCLACSYDLRPLQVLIQLYISEVTSFSLNIMEDIVSVFGKAGKENIEISEDNLKKLLLIKWCTLEAIRLRSPGAITKKVVNPIKIQTFTIPAGDMLMLSPYWVHRNPKYFPDPETFKPDRWKEANLEKNAFLDGFVAFGGGKHQCPGRWLAIMEVHMLVVLFLYKYEFILLDPVPKEGLFLHCLGTHVAEG
uniref:Lanosterol 14-alpha demethylase n=1 Tax=Chelydra serpentina TaxID=8475 RepID=A0A8C3S8Q8_CHESE